MSEHTAHSSEETREPAGKPSQAEGERDPGATGSQSPSQSPAGKPSQAEGERETVEEDLGE